MEPKQVQNKHHYSLTDYAFRDVINQTHGTTRFGRVATTFSLIPMLFDSGLNLLIDTWRFLRDGGAGLYQIARSKWKKTPAGAPEISFEKFVSFCKEHFEFSGSCLNATVKGLVLSWYDPEAYLELLPSTREELATALLQPEEARTKTFCDCFALYKKGIQGLPQHAAWYAKGLAIVIASIEHGVRVKNEEGILPQRGYVTAVNQFMQSLPAGAFKHRWAAGELLRAIYALPKPLREAIDKSALIHNKMTFSGAAAAMEQFLHSQTLRERPVKEQIQAFEDFHAFLQELFLANGEGLDERFYAQVAMRADGFKKSRPELAYHIATNWNGGLAAPTCARIIAYCEKLSGFKRKD